MATVFPAAYDGGKFPVSGCIDPSKHTSLVLSEGDAGFNEVQTYAARLLREKPGALQRYGVNRVMPKPMPSWMNGRCGQFTSQVCQNGGNPPAWECEVVVGDCLVAFDFEGGQIWLWKRTEDPPVGTHDMHVRKFRELVLFAAGNGAISLLQRFVTVAHNAVHPLPTALGSNTFLLYRWKCNHWQCIGPQPGRSRDTLVLPGSLKEDILGDVEEFLSKETRQWYFDHGIPYKRSLLLYGPPGSGKSSLIRLMATKLQKHVCFIQPSLMNDAMLATAIEQVPMGGLLVLEDVDALFAAGRKSSKDKHMLTFSAVLNVLDGIISPQNGQVFILTSNHPEKLDPAMIRSGRIDERYELPAPDREQIKGLFVSFYPDAGQTQDGLEHAYEFADQILAAADGAKEPLSMASLQGYFIKGRKLPYQSFMEELPDLIKARASAYEEKEQEEEEDMVSALEESDGNTPTDEMYESEEY